jgi:hypothetical protein
MFEEIGDFVAVLPVRLGEEIADFVAVLPVRLGDEINDFVAFYLRSWLKKSLTLLLFYLRLGEEIADFFAVLPEEMVQQKLVTLLLVLPKTG